MQVLIAPIRDARGKPTGFVVVSQHHAGPLHRGRVHEAGGEPPQTLDAPFEAAQPALRFESVSCQTVVRQVANALRPMAKRMGLQFETKLPRRDLVVLTDRRALTDILLSLTNHAIGLTDRGKIRFEAGARRDDQGRRFSEIRVVGGAVSATGAPRPQTIGQELATRLGGRISVDYERGRRSAFALVLPDVPPRR
jgi:signal transduction histidine kinase